MKMLFKEERKTPINSATVALYLNMPFLYKTECYPVGEDSEEMVFLVVVKK